MKLREEKAFDYLSKFLSNQNTELVRGLCRYMVSLGEVGLMALLNPWIIRMTRSCKRLSKFYIRKEFKMTD